MGEAGASDTLTFLFADLESSTRLWETAPEAMAPALERHDMILRQAVTAFGGRVLKGTGDGIMAIFDSASNALRACSEAQQRLHDEVWQETGPLRARMGLHTGEAQSRGGDYFGPTVNRAARIMAAAHGGQVLLSQPAARSAWDRLPDDASLRDLGERRLKDLLQPERIFQLVHPLLPSEFPPVNTLDRRPNNLPIQISEFVGRTAELDQVGELLQGTGVRLLTLLGPGGIGKTRIALQAAADQIDAFDDGVYFVDLSPVRDRDTAFESIVRTAELSSTDQDNPLETLRRGLATRNILLLLDNFEQVMDAADGVTDLLSVCPRLKILVTTREALRVRGERVVDVPSLTLPPRDKVERGAETLSRYESVRLFSQRAREAQPGFELTDDNAAAVAEICQRLDGLPLAIELAAARLRLFSPEELRDRLRGRLELLRGGARDLPARQRTLRNTIEWSYELLDAGERSLFRLLSVFSTTTVTSVEEVVDRLQPLKDIDAVDGLTSLMEKSLVRRRNGSGPVRLSMLETIREYAAKRLEEEADFCAAARRAHAEYFAQFARSVRERTASSELERALDELEAEIDNLRTAWRYWVAAGDLEKLDDLADSLLMLYDDHGWYHAAVELTRDLLGVLSTVPSTPERAAQEIALRASLARGLMAILGYTDEVEQEVEDAYREALAVSGTGGDAKQRYQILRSLASFYLYHAEFEKAAAIGQELLEIGEEKNDESIQVEGHLLLGCNLAFQGYVERGLAHLDRSIELFAPERHRPRGFLPGASPGVVPYTTSALLLWQIGYPDQAAERAEAALELAERLGHPFTSAYALFHVGLLDLWRGEPEPARQRAGKVLEVAKEHDYKVWTAVALVLHGVALTGLGQPEEGLDQTERGVTQYRGLKTPPIFWPVLLSLRAAAFALAEMPEAGLGLVDEAVDFTSEDDTLRADLLVMKGDLLMAASDRDGALDCYGKAFQLGQRLSSRMTSLRALTRSTRLRRELGQQPDGSDKLREVYGTFTEGFATHHLLEARALLDAELGG